MSLIELKVWKYQSPVAGVYRGEGEGKDGKKEPWKEFSFILQRTENRNGVSTSLSEQSTEGENVDVRVQTHPCLLGLG